MRKLIAVFLVVAIFAASAFAIDLSAGGNLDYTHNWNYTSKSIAGTKTKQTTSLGYIGVNAFFDAQYVRLTFGPCFSVGNRRTKTKPSVTSDGVDTTTPTYTNLNLGILGKYPFKVGFANIFPMLGFEMSFNVSAKFNGLELRKTAAYNKNSKKDLNHYYFVTGVGADVKVAGNFFITPTAIFGVDMKKPTDYKTKKEALDAISGKYSDNTFIAKIGLGFGYKF